MAMPLLKTTKVARRFGGVTALAGVDLELQQGEILGLIGPNGSGKTTLVNCISGVLAVDEGDIWLSGAAITRTRRQQRAYAGLARTFQTPRLFSELSVRENVSAGLNAARGRERRTIEPLLERLRLSAVAREAVSGLSYGYQR